MFYTRIVKNISKYSYLFLLIMSAKFGEKSATTSLLGKSLEIANHLQLCSTDFLILSLSQVHEEVITDEIAVTNDEKYFSTVNGRQLEKVGHAPNCIVIAFDNVVEGNTTAINSLMHKISSTFNIQFNQIQQSAILLTLLLGSKIPLAEQKNLLSLFFTGTAFPVNSNVFTLFIANTGDFSLWEIYNIKRLKIIGKVVDGEWSNLHLMKSVRSPAGRRRDFHGQQITAIIRTRQPGWMKYKKTRENVTLLGGFSVQIFWNLQKMLNFSTGVVIGDGLTSLPNKTLGGKTVTYLNNGTADISLASTSIVPFRAQHLTFIQPTYFGIINCFFMQPAANSIRNIVTAPFHTFVWLSLIGTWVFLILTVKMSLHLKSWLKPTFELERESGVVVEDSEFIGLPNESQIEHEANFTKPQDDKDARFAEEIGMWAFTANCQKSWHLIPNSLPMRIIFMVGLLCGVVCFVGYSGQITSTLTVSIVPVKEFADLTRFKFLFTVHELSEPFQQFLQLMIDTQNLKQKVLKISTAEEVAHLLDPQQPRAFLSYLDFFYPATLELNYTEIFICSHISKVKVSPVLYKQAMFLKKGSQYSEIFNHKIIIMKERGFNSRLIRQYETNTIFPCGKNLNGAVDPIHFSDVFTAFMVVCIGFFLAWILFGVELIYKKLEDYKKI